MDTEIFEFERAINYYNTVCDTRVKVNKQLHNEIIKLRYENNPNKSGMHKAWLHHIQELELLQKKIKKLRTNEHNSEVDNAYFYLNNLLKIANYYYNYVFIHDDVYAKDHNYDSDFYCFCTEVTKIEKKYYPNHDCPYRYNLDNNYYHLMEYSEIVRDHIDQLGIFDYSLIKEKPDSNEYDMLNDMTVDELAEVLQTFRNEKVC